MPRLVLLTVFTALAATSCADDVPSALDPRGPRAAQAAFLGWLMFGLASVVFVLVMGLLARALFRRRTGDDAAGRHPGERAYDEPPGDRLDRFDRRFVVGGGVILPLAVLLTLGVFTVGAIGDINDDRGELVIDVIGHQFWWEVRYPESGAVTANEVHVPVGVPVELRMTSVDVIHSFWVPQISGKQDLVPGRQSRLVIQADEPGVYWGQCAEYCGLQHANMAVLAVAHPPDEFDAWLERNAADAAEPATELERRGREVLATQACAGCHTVRGTPADGQIGPDLTHFASRRYIGAGAVENTRGHLAGWVVDAQSIKPGAAMPAVKLEADELQAVVAYLESLR